MLILFLLLVSAYADTPCPGALPYSTGYATMDISESQCRSYCINSVHTASITPHKSVTLDDFNNGTGFNQTLMDEVLSEMGTQAVNLTTVDWPIDQVTSSTENDDSVSKILCELYAKTRNIPWMGEEVWAYGPKGCIYQTGGDFPRIYWSTPTSEGSCAWNADFICLQLASTFSPMLTLPIASASTSPTGCVVKDGQTYWVDPGWRNEINSQTTHKVLPPNDNTLGFPTYQTRGLQCGSNGYNCVKCPVCTDPNKKISYTFKISKGYRDTITYGISRHQCISRYDRGESGHTARESQYHSSAAVGVWGGSWNTQNTMPYMWDVLAGCSFSTYGGTQNFFQWSKYQTTLTCGAYTSEMHGSWIDYVHCVTIGASECVTPCQRNHYYNASSTDPAARCVPCGGSPRAGGGVPDGYPSMSIEWANRVAHSYLPYDNHTYQHCVPAHWSTCGELPNPDNQIGQRYVPGNSATWPYHYYDTRTCVECDPGYAAPFGTYDNAATECNLCSGGYGGNGTHCNKCPVDKYQAHKSPLGTPCADKACPRGQGVGDTLGSLENTCHVCPAGTFSDSPDVGQCAICDGLNHYTADANDAFTLTGAEQCKECPAGEYNTDSSSICCPAGQVPNQDNTACVPCTGCDCIVGTVLTVPGQLTVAMRDTLRQSCWLSFQSITEAHLPEATIVESYTFKECSHLAVVTIPKVTDIFVEAFMRTTSLNTIELPSVVRIYGAAFFKSAITSLNAPYALSIGDWGARETTSLTTVNLPNATTIGEYAFWGSSITSINAPRVNDLGKYAFRQSGIQSIDFPELVTVPDHAFYISQNTVAPETSLITVNLPKATTIGRYAFYNHPLTTVNLPEATTLGEWCFARATSLTMVNIPKATTIEYSAFYGSSITSINAPRVNDLGKHAFKQSGIQSIDFPELVTVPDHAFYISTSQTEVAPETSLITVNLPKATTTGKAAFYNQPSLTTVNLPEATTLGEWCFARATSLTMVNIPKATTIESSAFYKATAVYINAPLVTALGNYAFKESTVELLKLPEVSVENTGTDAWLDSKIALRVTDEPWNPAFCSGIKSTFRDKCSCS